MNVRQVNWTQEWRATVLGVLTVVVVTLTAELSGVASADDLKTIDWIAVGSVVARSAVSAVLAALGVNISGVSGTKVS